MNLKTSTDVAGSVPLAVIRLEGPRRILRAEAREEEPGRWRIVCYDLNGKADRDPDLIDDESLPDGIASYLRRKIAEYDRVLAEEDAVPPFWLYQSLIIEGKPLIIIRTPWPKRPPQRFVSRALGGLLARYGLAKTAFRSADPLLSCEPDEPQEGWPQSDRHFYLRLVRAFEQKDPECLPKFDLYEWRAGEFHLVRAATEG